jgi:hypothetical protein
MTGLVSAYERRDVHGAEEILRSTTAPTSRLELS